MGITTYNPTSPGRRNSTVNDFAELTEYRRPEKSLCERLTKHGGRNHHGRITSRHRGGGHKQRYRIIDFRRDLLDMPAKVQALEYDPNRTANLALLAYTNGEKRYILAPKGLKVGDERSVTFTAKRVKD